MIPVIMKVGTTSSGAYWIRTNKTLSKYKIGDKIKFKPQLINHAVWENGIITGWSQEMPLIERM